MGLDDFQQPTRDLLATLGEQVTVVRGAQSSSFLAFVDDAVQTVGNRGQVYGNKRVLAMMLADWQPLRGDVFTARGTTNKLEEVLSDDGIVVTVVLHG